MGTTVKITVQGASGALHVYQDGDTTMEWLEPIINGIFGAGVRDPSLILKGISCASYFNRSDADFRDPPVHAMWHWDISPYGTVQEIDEDGNVRVFGIPAVEV